MSRVQVLMFGVCCLLQSDVARATNPPPMPIRPAQSTFDSSGLSYDYGEALGLSILFYDAQRAGVLPANNPIPWRGDSLTYEVDADGNDLTGGWFDAGDHVKFNFPMAFTSWVLHWGFLRFPEAYEVTGQTNMMCDMIKWPLEYFLKCWQPDTKTLYTQIGDATSDHERWESPESMTMDRPAWQVNTSCPGSDVAGDMASAFASGYLVFKDLCPGETDFAKTLLEAAKTVYAFGDEYRGLHTRCYTDAHSYYSSDAYDDELMVAATWMYKATGEQKYLTDAETLYTPTNVKGFEWENKGPVADLLLYEATQDEQYLDSTKAFLSERMPGGTMPYTPCGLVYIDDWGAARLAANAAMVALVAADDGILQGEYKEWALSQLNYLLGDNNFKISYQVGFGDYYPTNYHHRGSSCYAEFLDCDIDDPGENPHLLKGALVGGPNQDDEYEDVRTDYVQNEVAVDYNAGFQGAMAGLVYFANKGELPAAPAPTC
uniref:Endoglucanase n=1 Tax=Xylophaga rikuzenica TaxID=2028187 RepID=A0A455XAN3_9BIVA|nr:GH9 cellulase [Xylophaga rikuzenica]